MLREYGVTLKRKEYRAIRNGTATAGLVTSQSKPGMWHTVRDGHCDCEGFGYRGRCSHVDALGATALVEQWETARQERDRLAAGAEELAAKLDALMGTLAEAEDKVQQARRELETLAGHTQDAETPHAEQPASRAA